MYPGLTSRLATAKDATPLMYLINSSFRNDSTTEVFAKMDNAGFELVDLAEIDARIKDSQPNYAMIVAESPDGSLVGHCYVRKLDSESPLMGRLAVDVGWQNRGIGGQVVAYAESFVRREWALRKLAFSVLCTRAGMIAWYTRRGYQLTGKTEPFPYQHVESFLKPNFVFRLHGQGAGRRI